MAMTIVPIFESLGWQCFRGTAKQSPSLSLLQSSLALRAGDDGGSRPPRPAAS